MKKIKLPFMEQKDFKFEVNIPVRFSDIDSLGHVNNAVYLSYFEEARVGYFTGVIGIPNDDPRNFGIILLEIKCSYRSPAFLGENLRVFARITWMKNKSMEMQYLVVERDEGRIVAEGSSILVAYDYERNTSTEIREQTRSRIAMYEGIAERTA